MTNMKNYMTDEEAKAAILDIGKRMYARNFVSSNDGNISVKVSEHEIWTTPTGVSKGYMKEEQLVKMDLDGNIICGTAQPSSEIKMHLRVYKEDDTVQAVTHAHPLFATAFAITGKSINKATNTEAIIALGNILIADYATPGTYEVPDSIAPYVKDYNGVLLANHGALTWGKNIYQAFYALESVENCAKSEIITNYIIGKQNYLNSSQIDQLIGIREKMGNNKGGVPIYTYENQENILEERENKLIERIAHRVVEIIKESDE